MITILSFLLALKWGSPSDFMTIVVQQDDTLWGYTVEYEGLHKMSSNSFIEWIQVNNDLNSSLIREGQTLILPIKVSALADIKN